MTNFAELDHVDLGPAAERLSRLVATTPGDLLEAPTPCPAYTVGDLVDHVGGLAIAFADAAKKTPPAGGSPGASGDASRLGDDWRIRIPSDLGSLAEAWRDPAAWSGTTEAGGLELPGEVAGLVAMNELVVHGWDLARATGQPYQCDEASLEAAYAFLGSFATGPDEQREGPFGPVVEVPDDAPMVARVVGLSGRHPEWAP
ncbi:MAG TPA: TIGR03086 family metal-binding protein [Acidimicrobiales bacterium]|nr:TIGR03086 family metal-binding protein [Acidimicrobiales bacterium]